MNWTDEKEATKLRLAVKSFVRFNELVSPLLYFFLPFVVVYLSSFTWIRLNVESAGVFVSSFVFLWWVQFPSSFPNLSTSPAVTRFFLQLTVYVKTVFVYVVMVLFIFDWTGNKEDLTVQVILLNRQQENLTVPFIWLNRQQGRFDGPIHLIKQATRKIWRSHSFDWTGNKEDLAVPFIWLNRQPGRFDGPIHLTEQATRKIWRSHSFDWTGNKEDLTVPFVWLNRQQGRFDSPIYLTEQTIFRLIWGQWMG